MVEWKNTFEEVKIGKGKKLKNGTMDLAILSIGHIGNNVIQAIERLAIDKQPIPHHYDMCFVKPLDTDLLHDICQQYKTIITVEDGCIMGGFGSAIGEFILSHHYLTKVLMLGVKDVVVEQGTIKELQQECGIDVESIKQSIMALQ